MVEIVPEGGETAPPRHLVDVALEEQRRRQGTSSPEVKITNENLSEYAKDGDLTFVQEAGETSDDRTLVAEQEQVEEEETYWRNRILEPRVRWSETVEEIGRLEAEAAELRQRFYREDDPFVRDRQIKPEWDRVLERLGSARDEARIYQAQVERVLNEAADAGADTAWLDEGAYLEPPLEAYEDDDATAGRLERHEVVDPPEGGAPEETP